MSEYRMFELRRRVQYTLLAGLAGAFLIPQVSFAAPTGGYAVQGGASIDQSVANMTDITSSNMNNVITWTDYSVNSGETVRYDSGANTNNYLNIVQGGNTSKIYGTITGGKDVYLVNPNGVIFGAGATVNVGNLHVSTQDTATLNQAAFMGGGTPINTTAPGRADVVNMGSITATKVEVVGKNIRFLNDANVTVTSSPVVLRTDTTNDGTAHIGYRGTAPATTKYQVNGAAATAGDNYYQLVGNKTELDSINNNLSGNYMLEHDIDLSGNEHTPIGGNTHADFTGKFDGNFFQVKHFKVSGAASDQNLGHAGLFGKVSGARIENVGVDRAQIMGKGKGVANLYGYPDYYAGGIVGEALGGTTLKNVYADNGVTIDGQAGGIGGIVGHLQDSKLNTAYSKVHIGDGGGIVGWAGHPTNTTETTTIENAYSDATLASGSTGTYFAYALYQESNVKIKNSYATGVEFSHSALGTSYADHVYRYDKTTGKVSSDLAGTTTFNKEGHSSDTYAGWSINNNGDPGATWRVYEGRTAPLLTAFMDGTATATYNYKYFNQDGTVVNDATNTLKSNNGADITSGLTYNSKYLRVVDADAPNVPGNKTNIKYEPSVDTNKVNEYAYTGTNADKTNGIRNAGTKAIVWSDQHGPNLRGANVTIGQREVSVTGGLNAERMYNGKKSVKDAFVYALTHGGVSANGFTDDDITAGSVHLNTTNFHADMDDKNVGDAKNVNFSGSIGYTGDDAANYKSITSFTGVHGTVKITKAPLYLTINKKTADNKTYDGTSTVVDAGMLQSGGTPNISLSGSPTDGTSDGTIMRDDSNTLDKVALKNIANPKYTDASGTEQLHKGPHKIQYKNVGLRTDGIYANDAQNYELFYTPASGTKTAVTSENVYLDGTIIPREVKTDGFKVYKKSDNTEASAQKVYDGNNEYALDTTNLYLSANQAAVTDTTGIVDRDKGHITFALTGGKGQFRKSDGTTATKNVQSAAKIAYNVTGVSDNPTEYQLGDYYVDMSGVHKGLDETFNALGAGKITPKTITATKKDNLTKVYDALAAHTDGNRNPITGNDVVTLSGIVSGDTVTNNSTATYASKDVFYSGGVPAAKTVTYNVAFTTPNTEESDNYTFDTAPNTTTVTRTTTLTGLGTITPRPVTLTFGPVTKIYDGTATNDTTNLSGMSDGTTGNAVLGADGYSIGNVNVAGVTSRYGDGTTAATFAENANAGNRSVKYTGISNSLGGNYSVANTQYGTGTITRRRIDPSGFQVLKGDGTVANATKVYDGNVRYALEAGASLVTPQAASGSTTGIVAKDYGKVTFKLKTGTHGTFTKTAAGNDPTTHVSEAHYVAYDIVAQTSDATNNPLTNYTFGPSGTPRDLETVNDANPAHATAAGSITPAKIRAAGKEITKVYDGLNKHTDGNRNEITGNDVVDFRSIITDETGGTPINSSSAVYADKHVAVDPAGNVQKKSVTYTAQLKGQYVDDYEIVDAGNTVISTLAGSGANRTLTATLGSVANMGTITKRKLKLTMGDVSKTYDATSDNATSNITAITDEPSSSVIAQMKTDDGITEAALKTAWDALHTAGTAKSNYGRGTGASFQENANASNGTPHDVRYTAMDRAFKNAFSASQNDYEVEANAYGKGTIDRKAITPNDFKVVDGGGVARKATKVYDGTADYTVPSGSKLQPGGANGFAGTDGNHIHFDLASGNAKFKKSDNVTDTVNVADAARVAYKVDVTADAGYGDLLKNYTLNGQNLESGQANVTGEGEITRRVLSLGLVQNSGIDKVYDGTSGLVDTTSKKWNTLTDTDSAGNVAYGSGSLKLVNDGSSLGITSNYVNGGVADKNVARSGSTVVDKNISYRITLTGGNAANYSFEHNGTTGNAEAGLTLSATGKITPKDLSGAFAKVTKVYDGTKNVPAAQVAFTPGAVIAGDNVTLGSHTEQFESENVRGSGTTWTAPDGTTQRNWVNYSGLTLGGTDAGNYNLTSTARGLGEITPLNITPGNVTFTTAQATKIYDGTKAVKNNESAAAADVKNYITGATVIVNGTPVSVRDGMTISSAVYDTTANVNNGTSQGVTYKLTYNTSGGNGNFTIAGGTTLTATGTGVITPKTVNATINGPLTKTYDAQTTVNGAAKNGAGKVVAGADDLVTLEGLVGSDKNTTTAVYADKNAGTGNRTVNYTITTDTADASNYTIKVNGAAVMTPYATTNNTIEKRKVAMTFAPVTKTYDGTSANATITPSVSAADAAVLNADQSGLVNGSNQLTATAGISSDYGVRTGGTFTADPNAGTNKAVEYRGIQGAMGTALGSNAGNYEFDNTLYGTGTITKRTINANAINFTFGNATKVYDGNTSVKHIGSGAAADIKNYLTDAKISFDSGLTWVDLKSDMTLDPSASSYDNKNVQGGAVHNVTYGVNYTGNNFTITGGNSFTKTGQGYITRKDVVAAVKSPLTKVYDATTNLLNIAKDTGGHVIASADDLVTLSGLVTGDGAQNITTAVYTDKNAGTGNRTVNYNIGIDAAHADNYRLVDATNTTITAPVATNNNTITKRAVNMTFAPVTKTYDGTSANATITPSVSAADAAVLNADQSGLVNGSNQLTATAGISSDYGARTGGTFTADPNAGTNKVVEYRGIQGAMGTALGSNAGNYEFAANGYGKGTITKANINTSDIIFATTGAHKVYDGTKTVKYNGSSASNDVKNYITTATANLGGGHTADLRGDLEIDATGTHYSSPNATNGTPDTVTYKFRLNNSNIEISGANEFEMTDSGTIDRRVLTLDLARKTGIDKIYDANANLVDTNTRHYDKFIDDDAKGNVTYASGTTNDNKLVRTANGAEVNDGATMTIEANYVNNLMSRTPDKHVARDGGGSVTTKDIAYRVSIDAANGGQNYKLSDGGTPVDAETGLNTLSAQGTISPRALTFTFGDVSKPYDTTAVNNTKTINNVAAADSDGRGTATLAADGITAATFSSSTGGVTSLYGAGNTDATFHSDPNVVTDANGNVIERGKDVQYANVGSVLSGANANNYTVADTAYGKGTIRKRTVSVNDFNFNISNATKEYDGTKDVEYVEGGRTYKDLPHLKKRFQTSTLDLGGGNTVPINLDDITLTGAKYNDERVAHATGINYDVTINAQNFEFNGGRDKRIEHTGDTITKRDLATKLPPHLVKEYDGADSFTETNTVFANAMARANLTGVVDRDKNKIRLAVNGRYDSPDASAETREEAEARTPAQAGRNVRYDLTLSGDTDTLSNYKIGTVETLDSDGKMRGVGSGKADIYKKTLTVGVDNIDKLYDGTRAVVRPNGTGTLPHPEAGKFRLSGFVGSESFSFDQTAADKIDGLYSDANVSRRNGAVVDKDISYSGIKTAFANYAGHDPTGYAKNYRVDSDTLSGKGKILPRPITANEITNGLRFDQATKVYDGTTKVKYNGENTPDALKNYLTSATVNVDGTPIDIKQDLTIRADEAYTHYDTQHVAGGAQPRVTYTLNYTGDNFDISGDLTKTANGVITKRKVTAFAPGQLTKVYDASEKVYDPRDTSIKTYRRGTRVTDGDSIVRMSTEDGDTGLLANDGVRNISTAIFDDKNVGKRKKVTYNVAVDSTHAGDYEIVDTLGNTISELTTRNNEITPRRLDLTFGNVDKFYDGTSTNEDMPATRVTDSDTRRTLGRDRARIFNDELIMQDAAGNDLTLPSDYGYGSTDRSFTPDANANQDGEPPKSVQYRNMGDALRTILGDNAKNYEFDETGYGKGRIKKANVRESDFRLNFKDAVREYDGTSNVDHAIDNLQDDSRWKFNKMLKSDIASVTGTYMSPNGSTPDKNAADRKIVDYKVRLNNRNFDFGSWDGVVSAEGGGAITKRKIIAETPRYLTKEYDGTKDVVGKARDAEGNLVKQNGDGLITFRHYNETEANKYDAADGLVAADTAGNTVRNATTALYADKNVAWKDGAWKNGHGMVDDMNVNYSLTLSGTDAANYEIVDADGKTVKNTTGNGKITPKDIHLKSDPQTRWINEGLPNSYTGTPSGSNYETGVNGEALPGEIYYDTPNGKLRWGDYAINGYYRASDKAQYQRPDGSRYQLADKDKTPDGDSVARNYRFIQDPANATALHIGPYVPDTDYYQALTQASKMIPDEYAYENASLDRRRHFGRDSEAEISYEPPSVNTIKDGVDITQTGIHVTDETVFTLMNEVFGGK